MKMKLIPILTIIASLFLMAEEVPTRDIEVKQLTPAQESLASYTNYSILESSGVDKEFTADKNATQREALTKEINAIIIEELKKKGKKVVQSDPDFYVAYSAGIDEEALGKKLDEAGKKHIHALPKAAIVLMLADAKNGKLLWMATAQGDTTQLPPKQKQERIRYAIRKMLQSL
jgi:hypothetical protein